MDLKAKLVALLKDHEKTQLKQHDDHCCPELAAELLRNRDALVEALCANVCACHHAGCCAD